VKIKHPIDLLIFTCVFIFLFSFFEPRYLFSPTTITGGDTISHFPTVVYLKEVLIPAGKIMGWHQGNYAGFPLFYHYFPLPFVLAAVLGYAIPLQVAFKLVSVLGIFLLPWCVYLTFRCLRYPFPIPILGASLSLPFLFMEANSMWGANIPSTLAGEISYGIGISLGFLFFGTLYTGIRDKKWIVLNGILVFLLGFSHGYSLIFGGMIGSFFLFTKKDFRANLIYLGRVYGLGLLLLGFWLLPFISTLPYVTEYVTAWSIKSIFEVLPRILLPGLILSIGALFLNLFERRTWYFIYNVVLCLVLYYLGPRIGVLDIRFIPILQIFIMIFGAALILPFMNEIKEKQLLPFIVFLAVILWTAFNVTYIKSWIKWNYEGFEGKPSWKLLQQISGYLAQSSDGRVVYEHAPAHNIFGSERVFENLPYLSKRKTLEGLYMQSSPSSPFIFYIQSEVSKVCSGPFPQYRYASLNLPAALPRLKLFNVVQYIVRSPEAKGQAQKIPALKLEKRFGDYEIYRLTSNDGHFVVPLSNAPVLLKTDNWKRDFYAWFRRSDLLDISLVYLKHPMPDDLQTINLQGDDLIGLPRSPIDTKGASIQEKVGDDYVEFTTNLLHRPHLIKASYHPNWQVRGAKKIYLVSPAFMLVYPEQNHVRLYFGKTIYNYAGEAMSWAGVLIVLISGIIYLKHARKT